MLNAGPGGGSCVGAVAGNGAPPTGAGAGPRQLLGALATYPPAIVGSAFSLPPLSITTSTTTTESAAKTT